MNNFQAIQSISSSNRTLTDVEVLSLADVLLEHLGHEDDGQPYRKLNEGHEWDARPQIKTLIDYLARSCNITVQFKD